MGYFFSKIGTHSSKEVIFNLDEFHTIRQNGKIILAKRGNETSIAIAACREYATVEYLMECIRNRKSVDLDRVRTLEAGP